MRVVDGPKHLDFSLQLFETPSVENLQGELPIFDGSIDAVDARESALTESRSNLELSIYKISRFVLILGAGGRCPTLTVQRLKCLNNCSRVSCSSGGIKPKQVRGEFPT